MCLCVRAQGLLNHPVKQNTSFAVLPVAAQKHQPGYVSGLVYHRLVYKLVIITVNA
jgi:hypothetical protein